MALEPFVIFKMTFSGPGRNPIPIDRKVKMLVFYLAHGEQFRFVAERFEVSVATAHKVIIEMCDIINEYMLPNYIQWPSKSRQKEIAARWELERGFPGQCFL